MKAKVAYDVRKEDHQKMGGGEYFRLTITPCSAKLQSGGKMYLAPHSLRGSRTVRLSGTRTRSRTLKTLRWYQQKCFDAVTGAHGAGSDRALIVMATGLGKMVVAAFIADWWYREIYETGRILFIMDQTDPLEHARDEFDEALAAHSHVMTGLWTGDERENIDAEVLFTTFQSMEAIRDELEPNAFTLVIVDEAHHSMAETYRATIEYFTPAFRLGMTATPNRMDEKNIRDLFGEEVYDLSLAKAMALRLVPSVEYRVLADNIDREALKALVKRAEEGDRRVSKKDIDRTIFLKERLDRACAIIDEVAGEERTIIFCTGKPHVKQVVDRLPGIVRYHTGINPKVLKLRLDDFNERRITRLASINKLNEAVDIPGVAVIIFLRGTESETIWLQQLGRALRGGPEKKVIVLDFVANVDRILAIKHFQEEVDRIAGENGGQKKSRRKSALHLKGLHVNFTAEMRDLLLVLERMQRDYYPTLEEASAAARALGIKRRREYMSNYRKDPRLPSTPNEFYAPEWVSWYKFLRGVHREFYSTLAEASAAARALGLQTNIEYAERFHEDPRLPSDPRRTYADDWTSWPAFLGKITRSFYPTLAETSTAAKALGILSRREYNARYQEDERLPSNPNIRFVDDWVSWDDFLEIFYASLAKARSAARRLKIKTQAEYHRRYRKDPRLPSNPDSYYRDEWVSWPHFLGTA